MANEPKLPDRLCAVIGDPFYDAVIISKVGVRVDGVDRKGDVEEYCVSGGWVRIRRISGYGQFRRLHTVRLDGVKVEPYWR